MLPKQIVHDATEKVMVMSQTESAKLWHRRLGHMNSRDLTTLHKYADDVPHLKELDDVCRACRFGKATCFPESQSIIAKSSVPLQKTSAFSLSVLLQDDVSFGH